MLCLVSFPLNMKVLQTNQIQAPSIKKINSQVLIFHINLENPFLIANIYAKHLKT